VVKVEGVKAEQMEEEQNMGVEVERVIMLPHPRVLLREVVQCMEREREDVVDV
jgi:hypothetical protein